MTNTDCWIPIPENSDFSIHNIPFGIFSDSNSTKRIGVAIGDHIIDLSKVAKTGVFDKLNIDNRIFTNEFLNPFIDLGKSITTQVRTIIQKELTNESSILNKESVFVAIHKSSVMMHMPVFVGDYTDFYSSIEHATNIGKMFRDPENALLPNWRHIPVGYHGRASSIVLSGVNVRRPMGQTLPMGETQPVFGPSQRIDFELEMAYIIGKKTELGDTVSTANAEKYIFGKVLFNDWSARDIQKWEYVPLGPFLAKNFASSISPWIVTMEALEPFRVESPKQEPKVLPYLSFSGMRNFDISLEVALKPDKGVETIISRSNFKYMYWNMSQQIAHHTINGCNLNVGDMLGSGTISGKSEDSYGSMIELSWGGQKTIKLDGGEERKFINDLDTVIMRGFCEKGQIRVGFGEVSTKLLPAKRN